MDAKTLFLTLVSPENHPQFMQIFALEEKSRLGSGKGKWQISGNGVLKEHCVIEFRQGVMLLKNLAPTEQTRVQGHSVPQGRTIILEPNDLLELGEVTLKLSTQFAEDHNQLMEDNTQLMEDGTTTLREIKFESELATETGKEIPAKKLKESKKKEGPQTSNPSKFTWPKFLRLKLPQFKIPKIKFSGFSLFKKNASPARIEHKNAWALERLIAVGVDLLFSYHILSFLFSQDLFLEQMDELESIVLQDLAKNLIATGGNLPIDASFLLGLFWLWVIYIGFRLLTTFIFGVSLGQLFCGLKTDSGIIWGRLGGVIRVLLEGLSSQFIVGDLPALFGIRTLKEILTSTRIVRRSFLFLPLGLIASFLLILAMPFSPYVWYDSVFLELNLGAESFGKNRLEVEGTYPSNRFSMKMANPKEKYFLYLPSFQVMEGKGKKIIRPELFIYDITKANALSFKSEQSFDLKKWLMSSTRGQFFYPLLYPQLFHALSSGEEDEKKNSEVMGKDIQMEIRTFLGWVFNKTPLKIIEEGAPFHPLLAQGYAQGLKYFDRDLRGSGLSKVSYVQLGSMPALLLYYQGPRDQKIEILPLGFFQSQKYELRWPKEADSSSYKTFLRDILGQSVFLNERSKILLGESPENHILKIIDEFADKKLSGKKRKDYLEYLVRLYKDLGAQYFSQRSIYPELDKQFYPMLLESLDSILLVVQLTSGEWDGDFSLHITELLRTKEALMSKNGQFFPKPLVEDLLFVPVKNDETQGAKE